MPTKPRSHPSSHRAHRNGNVLAGPPAGNGKGRPPDDAIPLEAARRALEGRFAVEDAIDGPRDVARAQRQLLLACGDLAAVRADHVARADRVDIPRDLRSLALRLLPQLATFAMGEEAHRDDIAAGHRLGRAVLSLERRQGEPWQEGLIRAFEKLAKEPVAVYPIGPTADVNAVHAVIDLVAEYVGTDELPDSMRWRLQMNETQRREKRAKFESARMALRNMRLAPSNQRAGGRARTVSAFTAARDFASALGLPFPERERDLRRERKTNRRS